MESSGEGGGVAEPEGEELGFTEINAAAEGLDKWEVYYVVKEIIGFILHMHQQIPAVLQRLENEFNDLKEECKSLEGPQPQPANLKPSFQRMHNMQIRLVKQRIRRLEKLMFSISSLLSSFFLLLEEIPSIQELILVLGASLARPQHCYEVSILNRRAPFENCTGSSNSKLKEALSRKVIRTLMSIGAGGDSYSGPAKLFLLVKAPSTLNLPLHFLPKRDFRYSKKVVPFRLHIKCRMGNQVTYDSRHAYQAGCSASFPNSSSADLIWFQCRHTVKGLASRSSSLE